MAAVFLPHLAPSAPIATGPRETRDVLYGLEYEKRQI